MKNKVMTFKEEEVAVVFKVKKSLKQIIETKAVNDDRPMSRIIRQYVREGLKRDGLLA